MKRFIMNYSGGLCSWYAAKVLVERFGKDKVVLLFADTCYEDQDLYRFLDESSAEMQVPVTRIADGRTPWDVFFDNGFIGNTRIDLCSRILKRELLDRWYRENCDPAHDVICVGLSRGEKGRYLRFKARMRAKGIRTEAPAMWGSPTKDQMAQALDRAGIELPDLYYEGFPHNNCGGFCVKAGHAQFRLLLRKRRDFYLFNEAKEEEFRLRFGKDVAILRDRQGGTTRPLTLREYRERVESGQVVVADDWKGCGCGIDASDVYYSLK